MGSVYQEIKIECSSGFSWFFFDIGLYTALEQSEKFLKRNKEKDEYKVFYRNNTNFGNKWIFIKKEGSIQKWKK